MTFEELARRIIKIELNRPVVLHDDNTQPSMYDLRIGAVDAPDVAIECVGAVDPVRTETWNVGPAIGPLYLAVTGDWTISIVRNARVRAIKQCVAPLLRDLEDRGLRSVHVNYLLDRYDNRLFHELESLGIHHASCFRMPGTGQVHMTMEGIGGGVDSVGSAIPQWIEEFLREPQRADVLAKLHHSGATHCHVFVLVTFGGAPWSVESYLTGDLNYLPAVAPTLPLPVTGVWIASTFGTHGVRWDGVAWRLFNVKAGLT